MISLNLISPKQKEYLRYEYLYLYVRTVTVLLLTCTVIISGLFLAARLLMQDSFATVLTATAGYSSTINERNRITDREIAELNKELKSAQRIQDDFTKWSSLLIDLNRAIPPNIQVTYLNVEKKTRLFNLNGTASTRDDFLKLKENLSNISYLEELSSPLTNLLVREDVSFQFSAKVKATTLSR